MWRDIGYRSLHLRFFGSPEWRGSSYLDYTGWLWRGSRRAGKKRAGALGSWTACSLKATEVLDMMEVICGQLLRIVLIRGTVTVVWVPLDRHPIPY
jgi:hypothetical protein